MLAYRQVQKLYLLAKRRRGLKYPEVGLQARQEGPTRQLNGRLGRDSSEDLSSLSFRLRSGWLFYLRNEGPV